MQFAFVFTLRERNKSRSLPHDSTLPTSKEIISAFVSVFFIHLLLLPRRCSLLFRSGAFRFFFSPFSDTNWKAESFVCVVASLLCFFLFDVALRKWADESFCQRIVFPRISESNDSSNMLLWRTPICSRKRNKLLADTWRLLLMSAVQCVLASKPSKRAAFVELPEVVSARLVSMATSSALVNCSSAWQYQF